MNRLFECTECEWVGLEGATRGMGMDWKHACPDCLMPCDVVELETPPYVNWEELAFEYAPDLGRPKEWWDGRMPTYNGATLSGITATLLDIQADEQAGFEDISLFGAPSECGGIVHDAAVRKLDELLQAIGLTGNELLEELEARVDGRWLYVNGVYNVLEPVLQGEW
jgi:hypothetical protein